MPGDDVPVLVYEHRHVEAKDPNAVGNLMDLLVLVPARIQWIRVKSVCWTMLDGKAGEPI